VWIQSWCETSHFFRFFTSFDRDFTDRNAVYFVLGQLTLHSFQLPPSSLHWTPTSFIPFFLSDSSPRAPKMSFYDRFRAPGGDLASFFRSITTPTRQYTSERHEPTAYEWELLRARQGGTKRLDFFDAQLRGPDGAMTVLKELQRSPVASSISL